LRKTAPGGAENPKPELMSRELGRSVTRHEQLFLGF
jgi:hypothetical protein